MLATTLAAAQSAAALQAVRIGSRISEARRTPLAGHIVAIPAAPCVSNRATEAHAQYAKATPVAAIQPRVAWVVEDLGDITTLSTSTG